MAASGCILSPAVFHLGGVVGVAGAGEIPEIGIVPGADVGVADDGAQGRAAGLPLGQTGEKLRRVGFFPGGGIVILTRCPALEKAPELFQIHRFPGGNTLQGHTDGRGVGLSENGEPEIPAIGAAHRVAPFSCAR